MSIKINMSVQRSVPTYNDDGLTLVIFKNAVLNEGREALVRVDSWQELYDAFSDTYDGSTATELKAFRELYSAEYLVTRGVSLLCYTTAVADTFSATDVANISDQEELNYKFIVMPYDFISFSVDTTTYNSALMNMVSTLENQIDAQLLLDLAPDTDSDNIASIIEDMDASLSSKIEIFINSGFLGLSSKFGLPSTEGFSTSESTLANGEAYDPATDFVGIPASLAVLARKALILKEGRPWTPVAGEINGIIPEFSTLQRRLFTAEKEAFQAANINVLINRRGVGNLMVSQNTMADTTVSTNPLIRSHVVTEALWLKRWIDRFANSVMNLPNNQKTWNLTKLKLDRILSNAKNSDGIEWYSILVGKDITMTEEDIVNGIMKVTVRYVPIRLIEEIEFNVIIQESDNTAEVSVVGGDL
jgi:hypothetical protein